MNKWTEHPPEDLAFFRGVLYALLPSLLAWALIIAVIVGVARWW